MQEKSLSIAFGNSLKEETIACISEYTEIGLDAVMEDGILKDIPIVSTAIALYKIGSSIKERHNLKKLLVFLNEINNGIVDEQKRKEYQQKFQSEKKFRDREIEYLLVLIDRYISYDKPKMLAKLYSSYLRNEIDWVVFSKYAEIVDRFLPDDQEYFLRERALYRTISHPIPDSFIRLSAFGLFQEYMTDISVPTTLGTITIPAKQEKTYKLTEFGEKLQDILND